MHAPGAIASLSDSNMVCFVDPLSLMSTPADRVRLNLQYLAEDRILCFEIVAKKNERWVLRYVKTRASTDVP